MKKQLTTFIIATAITATMLTGCSSGEKTGLTTTVPATTEQSTTTTEAPTTIEKPTTTTMPVTEVPTTTEKPTTTAPATTEAPTTTKKRVTEKQNLSKSEWVDLAEFEPLSSVKGVNGIIEVPKICAWDESAKAFVAADNGTNVNGESVVIRITEAGNLSDKVVYEDKLKEYETKKAEDTANGCVVEMEKFDGLKLVMYISKRTVTEGEMLRTIVNIEFYSFCDDVEHHYYCFEVDVLKPAEIKNSSLNSYIEAFKETLGVTSGLLPV